MGRCTKRPGECVVPEGSVVLRKRRKVTIAETCEHEQRQQRGRQVGQRSPHAHARVSRSRQ